MAKEETVLHKTKGFVDTIQCHLGPQFTGSDERILYLFEKFMKTEEQRERFLKGFGELCLDDSMSWIEKADRFLDVDMEEEESLQYFKDCWELLFSDYPWPLDQKVSPEK